MKSNTTRNKHYALLKPLSVAVLLSCSPLVYAAGPVTPGAGSMLQQVQQSAPEAVPTSNTGLSLHVQNTGTLPATTPIALNHIQITGNSSFSADRLHALVSDAEGKTLSLAQIGALAERITAYYHAHGYPLARAIIPAQDIQNGVVKIQVVEARYGKVSVDNHSRVNDTLLQETLAGLQPGQLIAQSSLDSSLLLLSDIPGVMSQASMGAGTRAGTSDLLVQTSTPQYVVGNVSADNYGNAYTGRARVGGTVNLLDPLHHGDVLSLTGLSSGSGLNYADLNYETLLNGSGTRVGVGYSALKYVLGGPLANVNGNGTANVGSVWLKQPLLRSITSNMYGKVEYDHLKLQDNLNGNAIQTARHLNDVVASVTGDTRNGSGISTWSISGTAGRVTFDNGAAQITDASGLGTQGAFSKLNAGFTRLQSLSKDNALYVSLTGQMTANNLDPSQQMIVGGPYSVRAYDMGILSADSAFLGTVEFRHQLGQWNGIWQALAFVDSEYATINTNPGSITGANNTHLSGAGVGLSWTGPSHVSASTYIASPIGGQPALVAAGNKSVLGWIQISKGF